MEGKKIQDYMNDIDEEFLQSERLITKNGLNNLSKKNKKAGLKTILLIMFFICIWIFTYIASNKNTIFLAQSVGNVSARYVERAPIIEYENKQEELNEEELFMKKNTIIAKGRVKNVRNIRIKFNNEMICRAVAEIEITQSYRGNCKSGELISVLIPCTIHIGLDALEHEVISNLRVGMNGIFMMEKYDQHSYIEEEGTILYLEDLAEYGFIDAHKYGFLENKGQLIFDRYTFKSIEKATKLEEVESYIKKMIE